MPPKRNPKPKPYGRQADGKTIKSISLESEVAQWADGQAGDNFSAWLNATLRKMKEQQERKKTS